MIRTTCCNLFRDLLSIDGKPGLSIVPVHHKRFGGFFRLQFCAMPVAEMHTRKLSDEGFAVLMSEQYISFCPFCGTKLQTFYKDSFFELPHLTEDEPLA